MGDPAPSSATPSSGSCRQRPFCRLIFFLIVKSFGSYVLCFPHFKLFFQETMQEQQQLPDLNDCLKLLKGERDEQRLAGLLLVTKFCKGDDFASLRRVYDAVGMNFLDRLLRTGTLFAFRS